MILGFLAVEAVGEVTLVVAVKGGGGGDSQRDALISGAKETGHAVGEVFLNAGGVVVAQLGGLRAGLVVAGIDEIGGLAARLGGEVTEGEHAGANHKCDKFFLVSHKNFRLSEIVPRCRVIIPPV